MKRTSQETAWGNSQALRENSFCAAPLSSFVLMENSTLKDCVNKVIYQSGDWKFVEVTGKVEGGNQDG